MLESGVPGHWQFFNQVFILRMKAQLILLILAMGSQTGTNLKAQSSSGTPTVVPQAVQNTINIQAGSNPITSITPETTNGVTAYRVSFPRNGTPTQLVIAQDGSILTTGPNKGKAPEVGLASTATFASLPTSVQNTLRDESGTTNITNIVSETVNGAITYRAAFTRDGKYTRLRVAPDGSILEDVRNNPPVIAVALPKTEAHKITFAQLPTAVQNTVKAYANAVDLQHIDLSVAGTKTVYQIGYNKGDSNFELQVAKDGTLLHFSTNSLPQAAIVATPSRTKLSFTDIPGEVQHGITVESNGSLVSAIYLTPWEGKNVYEVTLNKGGKESQVMIDESGRVVGRPVALVSLTDLSPAVQSAVQEQVGDGVLNSIHTEVSGGRTAYRVSFTRAGQILNTLIGPDGALVLENGTVIREAAGAQSPERRTEAMTLSGIPKEVRETINAQAGSAPLEGLQRIKTDDKVIYEVGFRRDGALKRLQILDDGSIVKATEE